MSKHKQYNEYLRTGGTMTLTEWEQDGRYDPGFEYYQLYIDGCWYSDYRSYEDAESGLNNIKPSSYFHSEIIKRGE